MDAINKLFGTDRRGTEDGEHWIGISDVMSGLMMVFMFIAVAYMYYVQVERNNIKQVAMAYKNTQVAIYKDLMSEFGADLPTWGARINEATLEVTFNNPDVLFQPGSDELSDRFKKILTRFFPRYVSVLSHYQRAISEIRIEGHTSSDWGSLTGKQAYFHNMALSQGRTRSTLEYVMSLLPVGDTKEWVRQNFAAIGYSSSKHIVDPATGQEDRMRSRRVNFRVLTNSDIQIRTIIEKLHGH